MGGPPLAEECMKEWRIQVSAFSKKVRCRVLGRAIIMEQGSDFKHIFRPFTPEEGVCG